MYYYYLLFIIIIIFIYTILFVINYRWVSKVFGLYTGTSFKAFNGGFPKMISDAYIVGLERGLGED